MLFVVGGLNMLTFGVLVLSFPQDKTAMERRRELDGVGVGGEREAYRNQIPTIPIIKQCHETRTRRIHIALHRRTIKITSIKNQFSIILRYILVTLAIGPVQTCLRAISVRDVGSVYHVIVIAVC